jgi:hypothetical protein
MDEVHWVLFLLPLSFKSRRLCRAEFIFAGQLQLIFFDFQVKNLTTNSVEIDRIAFGISSNSTAPGKMGISRS